MACVSKAHHVVNIPPLFLITPRRARTGELSYGPFIHLLARKLDASTRECMLHSAEHRNICDPERSTADRMREFLLSRQCACTAVGMCGEAQGYRVDLECGAMIRKCLAGGEIGKRRIEVRRVAGGGRCVIETTICRVIESRRIGARRMWRNVVVAGARPFTAATTNRCV